MCVYVCAPVCVCELIFKDEFDQQCMVILGSIWGVFTHLCMCACVCLCVCVGVCTCMCVLAYRQGWVWSTTQAILGSSWGVCAHLCVCVCVFACVWAILDKDESDKQRAAFSALFKVCLYTYVYGCVYVCMSL